MHRSLNWIAAHVNQPPGPFYLQGLSLIPAWISNNMPNIVLDEIISPIQNFDGANVEVWEWISNFTSPFIMDVITYLFWDYS